MVKSPLYILGTYPQLYGQLFSTYKVVKIGNAAIDLRVTLNTKRSGQKYPYTLSIYPRETHFGPRF